MEYYFMAPTERMQAWSSSWLSAAERGAHTQRDCPKSID